MSNSTTQPPVNKKISRFGYLRVKAVSPLMEIANVGYNVGEMLVEIKKALAEQVSVVVFPELGLTGYTCDDLFHQSYLLENTRKGLSRLMAETVGMDMMIAVGLPYQMPDGRLYNTAVMLHKGKILGMTLKKYLPNYNEFYDMRYFASGIDRSYSLEFEGQRFEAGNQIYQVKNVKGKVLATVGIEICEDLWAPKNPSTEMALCGANIILNLSASNELVGKKQYRSQLVSSQSSRLNCVYVYVSSGPNESVKDTVFGGASLIFENGNLLAEGERLVLDRSVGCSADVDMDKIAKERRQNTTFESCRAYEQYKIVDILHDPQATELNRVYAKNPFIPSDDPEVLAERCEEILNILSTGLARQMKGTKAETLILNLSGGMDSTLTSMIARRALKKLNLPMTKLITLSLPGLGTGNRTKGQSNDLAKILGSTHKEISIVDSVNQNFKDTNQPEGVYDAAYENAQARIRTLIAFQTANQTKGIHISGGSLSENAVGFSTFGGDQLSSYNILFGVVKSLSKSLIRHEINQNPEFKDILERVLSTTISPELLPVTNKDVISHSSEKILGNYEIIDFILHAQIRQGFSKNKIKFLLSQVYMTDSSINQTRLDEIVDTYFKRFYINQFKRTSAPQGIKIGIDLSPRSSWRMPDLAKYEDDIDE